LENEKLIIPENYMNEIIYYGRSKLPFEVCGILSGTNNYVHSVWKLKNEANSDRQFFVGKKAVDNTLQQIAKKEEKVLAIYHSHPTTAPVPSYADLHNHPDSEVKMIIISYKTKQPIIKCYSIHSRVYKESPIFIESFS
jgi:[CysO sulfur-carrier protein]-S-L-cysteine hydrolase